MHKNGSERKSCLIYGVMVLIQYLMVVVFNFMYTDNAVDPDTAKVFRHAVEMSRNHSLVISEWHHATTMEWDTAALLAAPFYSLTKNIYLSFALANMFITALLIVLVIRLFMVFGRKLETALKACCLLLIPYAFGMLDYFNMLMFNGSQYVFRIILPILLIILIETKAERRKSIENILLLILAAFLIIISSVSSGVYILVACILPVAAMVFLDILRNGSFRRFDIYQYIVCGGALLMALVGTVISVKSGEASIGNTMSLLRWYDLRYYFDCFVEGYFRLMGAMPGAVQDESVAVFSLRGFAFLFKLLLSVLLIITFFGMCRRLIFAPCRDEERENETGVPRDLRFCMCTVAFVNFIVIAVCETRYSSLNSTLEYRYLLPVAVPVMLCIVPQMEIWETAWNKYVKRAVWAVFTIGIIYTTCICYVDAHTGLDTYAYCDEIIEYVNNTDYETVIFIDDRVTAECCRIKDMSREYEAYSTNGCMDIVDYYDAAMYNSFYSPSHLLFAISGTPLADTIGSDRAAYYTYIESVLWFDVYEAQEFTLGFPDP